MQRDGLWTLHAFIEVIFHLRGNHKRTPDLQKVLTNKIEKNKEH